MFKGQLASTVDEKNITLCGAEICVQDRGSDTLLYLASKKHVEIARLLMDANAAATDVSVCVCLNSIAVIN